MTKQITRTFVEQNYQKIHIVPRWDSATLKDMHARGNKVGYNAGVYGWNWDVWEVKGYEHIAFIEGCRNFPHGTGVFDGVDTNSLLRLYSVVKGDTTDSTLELLDFVKAYSVTIATAEPLSLLGQSYADWLAVLLDGGRLIAVPNCDAFELAELEVTELDTNDGEQSYIDACEAFDWFADGIEDDGLELVEVESAGTGTDDYKALDYLETDNYKHFRGNWDGVYYLDGDGLEERYALIRPAGMQGLYMINTHDIYRLGLTRR